MPESHRVRALLANPFISALAVVLLFGAGSKWLVLPTLATDVDDIGVAVTLREAHRAYTPPVLRAHADSTHGPRSKLVKAMDGAGLLPVAAQIAAVSAVPGLFTYAPAQFVLTYPLVLGNLTYTQIVARGRLPSFAFGVLASLLMALAARGLGGDERDARMLAAATITACSWELFLYSAQMETYAVGVAGCALMLLMLTRAAVRTERGATIGEVLLVASLPWFQYQLLFLLPGYVAVRMWQTAGTPLDLKRAMRTAVAFGIPAIVSAGVLYHFFLGLHAKEGVSWNAGPHEEFLFHLPVSHSAGGSLVYALKFFTGDTFRTVAAILAFLPAASAGYRAMAVALVLLTGAGAWVIARDRTAAARSVSLFAAVTALVWCALIVTGRITLSPTRHSLALLPIVALCVAAGIAALGRVMRAPRTVTFAACTLCVVSFGLSYPAEVAARPDRITQERVDSLIARTAPDLVVTYDCTWNLRVMTPATRPLFDAGCAYGPNSRWLTVPPLATPGRILMITWERALNAEDFGLVRKVIEESKHSAPLFGDWSSYEVRGVVDEPGTRTFETSNRTGLPPIGFYAALLVRTGTP